MAQKIVMPQLGESVVEGMIVEWFVQPGDKVETGQVLLEVETDKANTEVPSTSDGYVKALLQPAGATVDVGTELIELVDDASQIGDGGSAAEEAPAEPAKAAESEPTPEPPKAESAPVPRPPSMPSKTPPPPRPPSTGGRTPDERPWNANNIVAAPTATPAALPIAQRSAAGAAAVAAASGEDLRYGQPPGAKYFKPPKVTAGPDDKVIPFSKRRGIISEHMVYSKQVSPHVPCFAEVDVTEAQNLRRKHKARLAEQGVRLSLLAFVLKATCEALQEYPGVNAVVGDDCIIQRSRVNLGCAVETPDGLLVPVIKDADTLSVSGLARAVDDIATRARNKKITVDDLTGGTFTVTNPGRKGNLFGAAIINQPQVGILRMGEIVRRPVVRNIDGEEVICIRSMMFLGLSYDHRIIDGVAGNGFLFRIRELLEQASFDV